MWLNITDWMTVNLERLAVVSNRQENWMEQCSWIQWPSLRVRPAQGKGMVHVQT